LRRLPRPLFIGIPVLWVAVMHLGPLVGMVRISLLDVYPAAPGALPIYGLRAWSAFLHGPGTMASLGRSLWLAALATAISFAVAWPLAWHVAVRVPAEKRVRRLALLVAPFWTGEVLRMFALALLLSNRGALNVALRWSGLTDAPIAMLYGTGSVLVGMVYTILLSMLLPLFAALDRIPPDLLEAATDLGAGPWRRQIFVVLPLAADGIASGAALTFLLALGVLAAPALLGGAGTPVFASVIGGAFAGASGRWPVGAAFGLLLLVAGTACAGVLAFAIRRTSRVSL
jgi:spermidine/putrescine transport system permease protein